MKLTELFNAINLAFTHESQPETVEVVISTKLPYITCGQKPCTGVKYASMGFDWEAGQFRITPEEDLICVKHDAPQTVKEWRENYYCPKCEYILSKKKKDTDIRYCSKCGQAVKWE